MVQKANILVVEDDLAVRKAIEDVLLLNGFSVQGAGNGVEALALMVEAPPDLILADIIMPEMNGYQFYRRVRNNEPWLWIPFIFLTAKDDAGDIRYGRELGADDYIVKPFEPEDLLAAIGYGIFDHAKTTYSRKAYHAGRRDGLRKADRRRGARRRYGRGR